MRTPSLQEFKRFSRSNYQLAYAVCMAQAFAKCERERVDAYVQPIFEDFGFEYSQKAELRSGRTGLIPNVRDLYLCDDEAGLKRFYECCDEAHRAHGFKGPQGHCPALVAEHLQIIAENHLLEAGCKLLGVDQGGLWGENRAKMLDLLMGACINSKRQIAA